MQEPYNIQTSVDKNLKKKKKKSAVYDSDTPVTLKQGQGHKSWYKLADPKQGSHNAKFEKSCLNNIREKANNEVLVESGNMPIISLEYEQKVKNCNKFWPVWCT